MKSWKFEDLSEDCVPINMGVKRSHAKLKPISVGEKLKLLEPLAALLWYEGGPTLWYEGPEDGFAGVSRAIDMKAISMSAVFNVD